MFRFDAKSRSACHRLTALVPAAITSVPANQDSIIVREKLSNADGWMYAEAAA